MARTVFEKIRDLHLVRENDDGSLLLALDRVFLHERTGSIALDSLLTSGRQLRQREHVFATLDHIVDTRPGRGDATTMEGGSQFIVRMRELCHEAGITLFDLDDPRQGITHVVAAEQGIALPGLTMVCPDSHTCTLGALGLLAWGVGSSDCEHALATGTLRVPNLKQLRVEFTGSLGHGVTAKDLVLHLIGEIGAGGGAGFAVEYCGDTIRALPQEARFSICNMTVEFSAFSGLIAPDDVTLEYVRDRPYTPAGDKLEAALAHWRDLATDVGASFDRQVTIQAADVAPTVTWGTSPQHAMPVTGRVPDADAFAEESVRAAAATALHYMGLKGGERSDDLKLQGAFIGSCTNSRLSDLRAAARVLRGKRVAAGVRALCVPGSSAVKRAAEAEGLHEVFIDAGFEWRESGCSLCFYAGGEGFDAGNRVISSTNRNFEGRQGRGVRTHLASPATVAASAVAGHIADPREAA
ncbi:MAG: 3-isopropylmalate dehydratase large subunit [Pseudomonadota bacterium]